MKKFLKFLLIVLIWLVIAAVLIGGALALEQPVSTALIILGVLFGAWIIFLILRRIIARQRAKKRAENLVNVESPPIGASTQERRSLRDWLDWRPKTSLERRFRRLVRLLAGSRLREQGDPLYVLPWYMLLGQDNSGKTELLAQSGLSVPTLDDDALRTSEDSLDWWLYNEAIVLDTPGSYVGIDEDAPKHREWPTLLKILSEDRIREPLNGIVVTISYDRLQGEADALFDHGRQIRKRIDDLMRAIKVQLPIYVVVTKCDQMGGFTAWCANLPDEALEQPMGMLNQGQQAGDGVAESFLREAVSTVADRIGRLMLVLVNERQPDPDLLRLPQTIDGLRAPLSNFVDGLFQANTFEESPRFQGLYFTGRERESDTARQAFARDLFTKILPANRQVLSTLSGAERAERHTRRLVLSGWGLAVLAVLAVMVGAWAQHKTYLNEVAEEYAGEFGAAESISERVDRMHTLRVMIDDVGGEVQSWMMPWFGVPGAARPEFVRELQTIYHDRTYEEVINPLDARFDAALADARERIADNDLPEDELAFLISSLVERINLLSAYVDGVRGQGLHDYPGPYDNTSIYFPDPVDPLTIERLNGLYKQALIWSSDPGLARQQLSHRRDQLVVLLDSTGRRMSWLIPWADEEAIGNDYRLSDFWDGTGLVEDGPRVRPAFTIAGYEAIQDFLEQIWWAGLEDEDHFAELEAAFQEHYRDQFFREWETFAREFDRGTEMLSGRDEWMRAVNSMATPRNPHFHLLEVMFEHFEYFDIDDMPDWARMVRFHDEMRSFAPDADEVDHTARNRVFTKIGLSILKKTGPVGKSLAKTGKRGTKTKRKLDQADARSGATPDERALMLEEAGEILGEYRGYLDDIAFNSDIRSVSHEAMEALFRDPDNPGKGEGPKAQAHQKMRELQRIAGTPTEYNEAFWQVFSGPLDVVGHYYLNESACYVQDQWEHEFLVELDGVPQSRRGEFMFGESGELWRFVDEQVDPFLGRRAGTGYVSARANGYRMPMEEDFLEFATLGREGMRSREDRYRVRIEALPTSANEGSVHRPSRTQVQLRCDGGDQDVVNFNFPVSGVFNWDGGCDDVILEIDIGQYTLEKQWSGEHGFPQFLSDFRTGQQRLRPEDFPRHQQILEDYGIAYIDVGFRFSGHEPVINRLHALPQSPPGRIAACWS